MAMFQPRYGAEQKAAVIRAGVDGDMTAPAIARAVEAGQLPEQQRGELAAFTMPLSTVRTYLRQERDRRAEIGDGGLERLDVDTAARSVKRRSVRMLDDELRRLERTRPQTAKQRVERVDAIQRVARAMQEVCKLDDEAKRPPSRNGNPDEGKRDREGEALAREARARAAEHGDDPPTATPTGSDHVAARSGAASEGAEHEADGDVEGGPIMAPNPEAQRLSEGMPA